MSTTPRRPATPTATITSTTPGETSIGFSGSGSDLKDGAIPASNMFWQIVRTSNPGNILQTRPGVSRGTFSPLTSSDEFLITLIVTDSEGAVGTASVVVNTPAVNTAPVVNVTGPTTGTTAGTLNLVFNATGTDDNDNAATLLAGIEWYIDGISVGVTGGTMNVTGNVMGSINVAVPAVGPHTVEARSLDSGGLTGIGTLIITLTIP